MNLEFRPARTEAELRSLLNLRHDVYANDPSLQTMVRGCDITSFDMRSLHFGAFDNYRAVAYMRMVQEEETSFAAWVKTIAGDDIIAVPGSARFPFETYCPDKTWNLQFLESLNGKKIGEAGKLAIHKDYRRDAILENFIRAFVNYCNETHRFDSGFGICTFTLERFYRRLGFHRANGALPFIHDDLPEAVMLQFSRQSSPPYYDQSISYSAAMAFSKC